MSSERLSVIALISGGKDSFFSLLHCISHGHRIVALANLYPAGDDAGDAPPHDVQVIHPAGKEQERPRAGHGQDGSAAPAQDLNSFMYQTVGHEVVPLYAAATGLPLYRHPIVGGAVRHERDYDHATSTAATTSSASSASPDETESMLSLLQAVKARHPEANAVCAGAILSTYQRTRVESIALRLGLVPLAYLWKYPILPHTASPGAPSVVDDTQLLRDMAAAGLEARIIKVASAGLDDDHLWECVTSDAGAARVKRALSKFGTAEGAALGEGGEFETIVLDGPSHLFKKRIIVPDEGKTVVREGGGSNWLMTRGAHLVEKDSGEASVALPTPDLLDPTFASIFDSLTRPGEPQPLRKINASSLLNRASSYVPSPLGLIAWTASAAPSAHDGTVEAETRCVVDKIKERLSASSLEASQIITVVIILRDMSAFPKVNSEYGKLFTRPNPPSRVTISCGELLPEGSNIVIYLTTPASSEVGDRDGLHVQSRSYWAPANIGPYSQAINIPVVSQEKGASLGLNVVSIAGQIPLIPASMELPTPSDTSLQTEVVLSLQHLWRIAAEMRTQGWTSAVAYFARTESEADMQRSAELASRAWRQIHAAPQEEDDAEDTVDPWDLKYNPQYASLGGDSKPRTGQLPDWSIFTLRQQNEPESCMPPFFAVEVESLPRQSAVEWHAHAGLSGIADSSAEFVHSADLDIAGWRACHMIVRTPEAIFMHTVVSSTLTAALATESWDSLAEALAAAYDKSLQNFQIESGNKALASAPYLAYVDMIKLQAPWLRSSSSGTVLPFAIIPCRSIWSSEGDRLGCVGVYRTALLLSDAT